MVPEGWEEHRLSDACELINGRGFKPHEWDTEGYPIIRIQNLNGSDEFNYYSGEFNPKILVRNGELLFAWSGSRGTSFGPHIWRGSDAVLNYHTWRVVPKETTSKDFLVHYLRHITTAIEATAHGASALVHTQKDTMEKRRCVLPPLPEQRKIADILSTWDEAIEKTEALLINARTQKRALMQQLLTGKRRFPEFEGQPWKEVRLGDVLDIQYGKSPKDVRDDKGQIPIVGTGGITGYCHHGFTSGPAIVLGRKGTIDTPQWVEGSFWPIDTTYFCSADDRTSLRWVFYLLRFMNLRRYNEASGVPSLSRETLRSVPIRLPSLPEQQKIARAIGHEEVFEEIFKRDADELRIEKKALMQQLLTGKRRVTV